MSPGTQFVSASNGNVISLMKVTENLCQLSIDFTRLHVDPFRVAIPDANDENSFCSPGNGRTGHEKGGSRSADRPEHFRKHTGGQTSSSVGDVQFDGHRSRLGINRVSDRSVE